MGLLGMFDDNEQKGLESFEATEVATLDDGTKIYSGPWKESRQDDPRHFVIGQPVEGKSLVYGAPRKVAEVLEASQWPAVYGARNEIQEHRFKDMIDHGALDINYGRKTLLGPARHHQRKQADLDRSLERARERVDKKAEAVKAQQDKVAESEAKGHGKRLEQRTCRLATLEQEIKAAKAHQDPCSEQISALGPAGQRADATSASSRS